MIHPLKLALSAIGLAFAGMYFGSSFIGLLAVSVAALGLVHQGHPLSQVLLGDGANYNKLTAAYTVDNNSGTKTYVYLVRWQQPQDFTAFEYIYNRGEVFFDSWSIQPVWKYKTTQAALTYTSVGTQRGENHAIRLYNRYVKGDDSLQYILVQFFYTPCTDNLVKCQYLDRFRSLLQKGKFVTYNLPPDSDTARLIPKDSSSLWTVAPAAFV